MTAVRGITSRVDIIWNSDGTEVERMEGVSVSSTTDNSVVYTDTYTISQLNTTDNGRKYQCEVVINTIQKKSAEDNVSLNVIGEWLLYTVYISYTAKFITYTICARFSVLMSVFQIVPKLRKNQTTDSNAEL